MTEEEYMIKEGWIDIGRKMKRVIINIYSKIDKPNYPFVSIKVGDKFHLSVDSIFPEDELGWITEFGVINKEGKTNINTDKYEGYIFIEDSEAYRLVMDMEYSPEEVTIKGGCVGENKGRTRCLINKIFSNRKEFLEFVKLNISHIYLAYDLSNTSFKKYDDDDLKGFFKVN